MKSEFRKSGYFEERIRRSARCLGHGKRGRRWQIHNLRCVSIRISAFGPLNDVA